MTHVRLDFVPNLLSDDLIRNLETFTANGSTRSAKMWTHIDAALPACVQAIQLAMRPGAGQGGGGVQTSDVTDRTFAEVAGRERGRAKLHEIARLSAEIDDLTRKLELAVTAQRRVADAQTLAEVKDAIRCSGGQGMPGNLVWGRPDCRENALHGPLCGPCSHENAVWLSEPAAYVSKRSDGRRGAKPKWDALLAASHANLRAGLEQVIREAS